MWVWGSRGSLEPTARAQVIFVYHGENMKGRTGINCAHLLPTLIYASALPAKGANNKGNCS